MAAPGATEQTGSGPRPIHGTDLPRLLQLHIPDVLTALAAWLLWTMFRPGLMSQDSLMQYGEAIRGPITDWHPPLMACVLRVVLRLGGRLDIVTLGQCFAGLFGVRAMSSACLAWFSCQRLSRVQIAWLSLLVTAVLVSPLTPLAFFLVTFWKDTWAGILILWIGALLIRIHVGGIRVWSTVAVVLLAGGFALLRHNSAALAPFVGFALWAAVPPPRRPRSLLLAAAPLLAYLAGALVIRTAFHVQSVPVGNELLSIDLVALCGESPTLCHDLPWTEHAVRRHPILTGFRPGNMAFPVWKAMRVCIEEMSADQARLRNEYRQALRRHPMAFLRLKAAAFVELLGFRRTYQFFYSMLAPNPYGLDLNRRFDRERAALARATARTAESPLRWFFGVHGVWLALNIAVVAGALIRLARRPGDAGVLFVFALALVPLSYYASYLVMAPAPDFRYMFPASLVLQASSLSQSLGNLVPRRRRARNVEVS